MFCIHCGRPLPEDNARFCIFCGAKLEAEPTPVPGGVNGDYGSTAVVGQAVTGYASAEPGIPPQGVPGAPPQVGCFPPQKVPEAPPQGGVYADAVTQSNAGGTYGEAPVFNRYYDDISQESYDATRSDDVWDGSQSYGGVDIMQTAGRTNRSPKPKKNRVLVIVIIALAALILAAAGVLLFILKPWESEAVAADGTAATKPTSSASSPTGNTIVSEPTTGTDAASATEERGNTSANIINSGLACEHDGQIYYQGNDGGIYRMEADGSGQTLIRAGRCFYLNVMGEHVFYSDEYDGYSLFRVAKTGGNRKLLSSDECLYVTAYNGYLYYLNAVNNHIYRITTGGEGAICLSTRQCQSFVILDDSMYIMTEDSRLYVMGLTGANEQQLMSGGVIKMTVLNGHICFRYKNDGERLYQLSADNQDVSMLCSDLCHFPNSTSDRLYYCAKNDGNALYHMSYSTGDERRLSGQHVYTMNIAGDWIIYRNAGDNYALYRMRLNGSDNRRV